MPQAVEIALRELVTDCRSEPLSLGFGPCSIGAVKSRQKWPQPPAVGFKVIADGKKAGADRIKAIHGHFYPIADHLNPIEDRFYPIAGRLKVIADGKKVIWVGFK